MMQTSFSEFEGMRPRLCSDVKSETSTDGDENDFTQDTHPLFCPQGRGVCSKAKTSLCKNFTERGHCPYGRRCQFAHGPEELRVNMEQNRSYKTKGCHAFAKKGCCLYGERCNFIHCGEGERDELGRWQQIYHNHRTTINPPEMKGVSRLMEMLGA